MLYRNQGILRRSAELGRRDIFGLGQESFGTFTAALNRTGLREFIGADAVGDVVERGDQLAEEQLSHLSELFGWIFGDGGGRKVIRETRQLTMLATVVQHKRALAELRRSRDLDAAFAMTQTRTSERDYLRQLATARGYLRSVVDAPGAIVGEPRAWDLVAEIGELLEELKSALDVAGDDDEQ
jgi:hypothetical protein